MKKILLILIIASVTVFAFEARTTQVGKVIWSLDSKKVYKACLDGYWYFIFDEGYHSALAPKFEEIDHPLLGKISQPAKCDE